MRSPSKTGTLRWWCDGMGPLVYTTPAVAADGTIIAFSGYGGPALAVRGGGQGDVTKTRRLWYQAKPKNPQRIGSPVVIGEHCYLVSEPGTAHCFEIKTGKDLWKGQSLARQTWSSLIATADGKLLIADFAGDTHVLAAAPQFKLLGTNSLGKERINATIAVSDGELFIRSYRRLWCIGTPLRAAPESRAEMRDTVRTHRKLRRPLPCPHHRCFAGSPSRAYSPASCAIRVISSQARRASANMRSRYFLKAAIGIRRCVPTMRQGSAPCLMSLMTNGRETSR